MNSIFSIGCLSFLKVWLRNIDFIVSEFHKYPKIAHVRCADSSVFTRFNTALLPRSGHSEKAVKNTEEGHLIFKKCDVLHERYQIKRELGEGTFGKVVLCKDKERNGSFFIFTSLSKTLFIDCRSYIWNKRPIGQTAPAAEEPLKSRLRTV